MRRRFRLASWAFTLTELVIAISIIALLVAMLLPVINKSRRAAQAVVCLANLRTLGQAMRTYATENHDYLPGSPSTTARHLWNVDGAGQYQLQPGISRSNVPSPAIELFDYLGPLAQTMRIALPETDDGTARFRAYRNLPQFSCPANATTAMPESGETIEAGPMLSYVTGVCFMLLPWTDFYNNTSYEDRVTLPTGGGSPTPGTGNYWLAPAGYVPKLRKVGPAQGKIFLADAARR
ncbi:MAG TPA: type II secretion system protein, partial [Tepidisphaeraceae bacterium]